MENDRSDTVRYSSNMFFYLLFFINEDRNTVSSPPLQTVLIEEVAYVKIIVTGGTHTLYSS